MQSLTATPRTLPEREVLSHRFHDDLQSKLLSLALGELPKPLSRSQKARRDYIPEAPVVYAAPKRNWFHPLLRLWRLAVVLAVAALILFGIKASNTGSINASLMASSGRHPTCIMGRSSAPLQLANSALIIRHSRRVQNSPRRNSGASHTMQRL
jgi:hypothetical protein